MGTKYSNAPKLWTHLIEVTTEGSVGRDVEDMFHDRKMRIKIPQLKSRGPEDMDEMLAWYGFLGVSSDATVSLHISPRTYLNILSWTVEIFPNLLQGLMVIVPTSSREGVIVLRILFGVSCGFLTGIKQLRRGRLRRARNRNKALGRMTFVLLWLCRYLFLFLRQRKEVCLFTYKRNV